MMMNIVSGASHAINTTLPSSINTMVQHMEGMGDDMSEASSSESAPFDDSDLLNHSVVDDITSQLAAAGPIGVAAAAAIATGKKRKRPHAFETNPSIRKRQQTRLLRKLKATIEEYTTRVGQQAIVLSCTPGKPSQSSNAYKVFGSQPLENVIRSVRTVILNDLENALAHQAPPQAPDNPTLHELPPLNIDGIPTPVDKMTQAQLRAFIPEMLKYSTGRSKPGWGKPEYRPIWWPNDVPWANVRSDVRTDDEKKRVSWTHALRQVVKNCYKHHGREDLMPQFDDNGARIPRIPTASHFQPTMVQTINNPDGTVSIIQIDTGGHGNAVVQLSDGSQAVVQAVGGMMSHGGESTQAVHTLAEVASNHRDPTSVPLEMQDGTQQHGVATLAEATLSHDGQLILTSDSSGLGMVTLPVSMYQTVVTNISQLQESGQNVQIAMMQPPKMENGDVPDATQAVEVMTVEQS